MVGVRRVAGAAALIDGRLAPPVPRHFLDIDRFDSAELRGILDIGVAYKHGRRDKPLAGKTLAMIFEKPSTRTRVSFEVAAAPTRRRYDLLEYRGHAARPRRDCG